MSPALVFIYFDTKEAQGGQNIEHYQEPQKGPLPNKPNQPK